MTMIMATPDQLLGLAGPTSSVHGNGPYQRRGAPPSIWPGIVFPTPGLLPKHNELTGEMGRVNEALAFALERVVP
jgi:hypothetical protein